jgi:hypothetical protein
MTAIKHVYEVRPALRLPQKCPQMNPSSSFIGGKRLQPPGEAWRLSQRSLVDESSPWLGSIPRRRQRREPRVRHVVANLPSARHSLLWRANRGLGFQEFCTLRSCPSAYHRTARGRSRGATRLPCKINSSHIAIAVMNHRLRVVVRQFFHSREGRQADEVELFRFLNAE